MSVAMYLADSVWLCTCVTVFPTLLGKVDGRGWTLSEEGGTEWHRS